MAEPERSQSAIFSPDVPNVCRAFIAARMLSRVRSAAQTPAFPLPPPWSGLATTPITEYSAHLFGLLIGVDYKIREWVYVGVAYDVAFRDVAKGASIVSDIYTTGVNSFVRHQLISKVGVSY